LILFNADEQINYVLLVSRQGKVRLSKWFTTLTQKEKTKIVKDVTQLVLSRRAKMCNFLEYKGIASVNIINEDSKIVYRRYASLFFICGIETEDNELITLEIVHRYVEVLDRYFGNVWPLRVIVDDRCVSWISSSIFTRRTLSLMN
jgi:AP-1 complex subunit sigma 1/2